MFVWFLVFFACTHWEFYRYEGVNKGVEQLFSSFYYVKQEQVIHQKHLRHKNTKGNVKVLPLFSGRPSFIYIFL